MFLRKLPKCVKKVPKCTILHCRRYFICGSLLPEYTRYALPEEKVSSKTGLFSYNKTFICYTSYQVHILLTRLQQNHPTQCRLSICTCSVNMVTSVLENSCQQVIIHPQPLWFESVYHRANSRRLRRIGYERA